MFPQLRERIGSALDLVVEFSTLGEYRLDADGVLWPASALTLAPEQGPQLGGAGDPYARRAAVRRIVAGGAAGPAPVATPAARRLAGKTAARPRLAPGHGAPAFGGLRPADAADALACRGERRRGGSERTSRRDASGPGPEFRPGAGMASRPGAELRPASGTASRPASRTASRPGAPARAGAPARPGAPAAPEQLCFAV